MAVIHAAQPIRTGFIELLLKRALVVAKDPGFQRVLLREGQRFLVAVAAEARAVWLRSGQ